MLCWGPHELVLALPSWVHSPVGRERNSQTTLGYRPSPKEGGNPAWGRGARDGLTLREGFSEGWLSNCCLSQPPFCARSLCSPTLVFCPSSPTEAGDASSSVTAPLIWGTQTISSLRLPCCLLPLFSSTAGEGNSALSPLNPGELLIALHNIDSVKCDMKSIIKGEVSPHPLLSGLASTDSGKKFSHPHVSTGMCQVGDSATYWRPIPELQHPPLFLPPSFPPSHLSFLSPSKELMYLLSPGTELHSRKLGSPGPRSRGSRAQGLMFVAGRGRGCRQRRRRAPRPRVDRRRGWG